MRRLWAPASGAVGRSRDQAQHPFVLAAQGLVGGRAEVDDREPAVNETDRRWPEVILPDAFGVRAAVAERRTHAMEDGRLDRRAVEMKDPGQAAQAGS